MMYDFIKNLFAFVGKANSEDNGNPSNARTITFLYAIIIIPCLAYGFINTVLKHSEMTLAFAGLLLTGLFSLQGIKTIQKAFEKKANDLPAGNQTQEDK